MLFVYYNFQNKLGVFLTAITKWGMPSHLEADYIYYRRAQVLIMALTFSAVASILAMVITFFTPENKSVPFTPAIIAFILLLYYFKKTGRMGITGNLFASIWAVAMVYAIPETGGITSDNMTWMVICPIFALLFANRLSGFIWLLLISIYAYYQFLETIDKPLVFASYQPSYFFFGHVFLFFALFMLIIIFEDGQRAIIATLEAQKKQLEEQKKLLEHQRDMLEKQKMKIDKINRELIFLQDNLKESNAELETFAFAASHDLKEPLRMIGMYTQLIQRRIKGHLDDTTLEFMGFITSGVSRMQVLLDDLLRYSRLGKNADDINNIDLNKTLFVVIHNLSVRLQENKGAIIASYLPTIRASAVEMVQLFQNLIGNAIKFRREEVNPEVLLKVKTTQDGYFLFSLSDNGIGIPEQHKERVFKIFERLNGKTEFEGSGIGLATCKKIVNNAGGRIWLDSTEGVGTTFYFTLPVDPV
jgi:signal transduction histidine kinase